MNPITFTFGKLPPKDPIVEIWKVETRRQVRIRKAKRVALIFGSGLVAGLALAMMVYACLPLP